MSREMSWRPPISLLVASLVVLPIILTSAVLVSLTWASSVRIAENLGEEVMEAAAARVAAEVRNYLGDAVHVSDRYVRRMEGGVLPDPPRQAWERAMLDDLATTPSVASICYGNSAGDATWLLRGRGRVELGRATGAKTDGAAEFVVDPHSGQTVGAPLRVYTYDPRQRPWWTIATSRQGPSWTPIYAWFADNTAASTIGTGYTRALRGADGNVRGVLVVDVTLGALSDFLRALEIAGTGRVFIVDEQDRLVASSHGGVMDDAGRPLRREPVTSDVTIDGAPARARVAALRPYPGIDWRVVAMLPESAFMADAQRVRSRAIGTGVAVALASLVLGLALSRYLSRPIVRVTSHVQRVGAGDFDSRLSLTGARELRVLSDEINRMAGGLKQRMALEHSLAVAMEVQQSLLPAADPTPARLDVAGHSKYCDETGGDYYDFIDVTPLSTSSLLVAVGDVMGHGIAAALLMATARAALRCVAIDRPSLGALMTRTNRVLAASNRANRFMTLALLEIDGETRAVRWASAGHDPAIVYDPRADASQELEGGDIPLGVTEDVEYEDYTAGSLAPGSVLVIGTDGVWEMCNERDQQYGKERLRDVVRRHHASCAKDIAAALEADLAAHRGARAPEDDVTFVIVKLLDPSIAPVTSGRSRL